MICSPGFLSGPRESTIEKRSSLSCCAMPEPSSTLDGDQRIKACNRPRRPTHRGGECSHKSRTFIGKRDPGLLRALHLLRFVPGGFTPSPKSSCHRTTCSTPPRCPEPSALPHVWCPQYGDTQSRRHKAAFRKPQKYLPQDPPGFSDRFPRIILIRKLVLLMLVRLRHIPQVEFPPLRPRSSRRQTHVAEGLRNVRKAARVGCHSLRSGASGATCEELRLQGRTKISLNQPAGPRC